MHKIPTLFALCFVLQSIVFAHGQTHPSLEGNAAPLVIGEMFIIKSKILGETRRINVYMPPDYTKSADVRLPVLYMPDGGIAEDFLHVAGLVQVSVGNGMMRPFLLVGMKWHYEKMPDEKHSTIYHPAALKAFRLVFKPEANEKK